MASGSCWLRRSPAACLSSARIAPAGRTSRTRRLWHSVLRSYPSDDLSALVAAVAGLRDRRKAGECLPPLADSDRETLSWAAYGRRYAEQIAADFGQAQLRLAIVRPILSQIAMKRVQRFE